MQNGLFGQESCIQKPEKYSYSMLRTYDECPFRFKLIYQDKISSSRKQRHYLMMGLILHQALFDLFKLEKNKRNYDSMLEILNRRWKKWNIDQHKEKYCFEQCKNILMSVPNTLDLGADSFLLEQKFKVSFDNDLLIGTIDRIDRLKDGTYEIIDYKLGDKNTKNEDEIKKDLQWFVYWYAFIKRFNPMRPKKVTFIFLDANKRVSIEPTPLEEKDSQSILKQQINLIKTDKVFTKRPGKYCDDCYFLGKECK